MLQTGNVIKGLLPNRQQSIQRRWHMKIMILLSLVKILQGLKEYMKEQRESVAKDAAF